MAGEGGSMLKRAYTSVLKHAGPATAVALVAAIVMRARELHAAGELAPLAEQLLSPLLEGDVVLPRLALAAGAAALAAAVLMRLVFGDSRPVYLVDFSVHKGRDDWRFPKDAFVPLSKEVGKGKFTEDDLDFQGKILMRSGLGDDTYVPPWLYSKPPHYDMVHARKEFEVTCFSAVKDLLNKTGINPRQIGFVITNCSLFNPTPSLSASLMNHFKMPSSTINYNLGGMGCSAGVVAIDLARSLLQIKPGAYALVVSHENLTSNWYPGSDRSMLVPNCIFRSNGAAILLSNKSTESWRAKYSLDLLVRTTIAKDEEAFQCVYQCEDSAGVRGVRLAKELMSVAGRALKQNLTEIGPMVLPLSEKLLFAGNLVARAVLGPKKVTAYVPDFTTAFNHICIHTGGRAVLDTMEKQLGLGPSYMEPSRAGLYRFGNVSSTSIWYVLAFIESYRGVKRGDKVWQLGFGSGFKCNSAVWTARRGVKYMHPAWEGFNLQGMRDEFDEAEREKAAYLAAKAKVAAAGGKAK